MTKINKSQSAEYGIWRGMLDRCYNPVNKAFRDYGKRGIEVCRRWRFGIDGQDGYECFLEDMGPRPCPSLSLDRRDFNAGYSPDNCAWATPREQAANRRVVVLIEYQGRRLPLTHALFLKQREFEEYGMAPGRTPQEMFDSLTPAPWLNEISPDVWEQRKFAILASKCVRTLADGDVTKAPAAGCHACEFLRLPSYEIESV